MSQPLVSIVMGSDSDLPVMQQAAKVLDEFVIGYEIHVLSAHRTPEAVVQVYAARAISWEGLFAVHTWIAVKPTGAAHFTVHEVFGYQLGRAGTAECLLERAPGCTSGKRGRQDRDAPRARSHLSGV